MLVVAIMVVLMFWPGNFREWDYITVFTSAKIDALGGSIHAGGRVDDF